MHWQQPRQAAEASESPVVSSLTSDSSVNGLILMSDICSISMYL